MVVSAGMTRIETAGTPWTLAAKWLTGKTCFQQPYDFFFAALAVIVFATPIVDTVCFIPQKAVDKSSGTLSFDESYKSPDSEIVRGGVHVLAAGELVAFPTPL